MVFFKETDYRENNKSALRIKIKDAQSKIAFHQREVERFRSELILIDAIDPPRQTTANAFLLRKIGPK